VEGEDVEKQTKEHFLLDLHSMHIQKLNVIGKKLTNSVEEDFVSVSFKHVQKDQDVIKQIEEQDILEKNFVQHQTNLVYGNHMVE